MPDPVASSTADTELRAHVERALSAHYELDCEIGRGGMGIVYRAKDRRLKRVVAIKVLPPELAFRSEIRSRFLREAETAAQLNHPNIVDIYSVDETEGIVYFVMAYISGDNLAKRLHDKGVLPPDEVRRILREVADALAYAHERGVVHRDIKPDNILLDAGSGRPMVTDFGIARAITEGGDSRLTATGMAIGTPAYMSPEQAAGEREIDGRSDLYSLGIVAYQMLVGEPPFVASSTPAMLVKHLSERPTPIEHRRSDIPEDLGRAVMLCLEKDPSHRFPSATSLVAALDEGGFVPQRRSTGAMPDQSLGLHSSSAALPSPYPQQQRPSPAMESYGQPSYAGGLDYRSSYGVTYGGSGDYYVPSAEEARRWDAHAVVTFRKKLAPYLFINAVIVLASIVGFNDFFPITVFWSIYIAYKYARLWSDGYDWRDVFRQPRDRELIDVADDLIEHVKALFSRQKRQELRQARRERQLAAQAARTSGGRLTGERSSAGGYSSGYPGALGNTGGMGPSSGYGGQGGAGGAPLGGMGSVPPAGQMSGQMGSGLARPTPGGLARGPMMAYGAHHERVRQAIGDRDGIVDLYNRMSRAEREQLPDVQRSAFSLAEKVEALAKALADIEREMPEGGAEAIEAEITRLEAQANPLEKGSEERVRRLAALRRQRPAATEQIRRRNELLAKLESCAIALQNTRSELLRFRSGQQSNQRVTTLVNEALSLAQRVDNVLYVADEMDRLNGGRGAAAHPAS